MDCGKRSVLQIIQLPARSRGATKQSENCRDRFIQKTLITLLVCVLALSSSAALVIITEINAALFQVALELARVFFVALYFFGL